MNEPNTETAAATTEQRTETATAVATQAEAKPAEKQAEATPPAEVKTEENKPDAQTPGEIALKLPDGVNLEQGVVDEIAAFSKAQGLSQTQAQALLDHHAQTAIKAQQKSQEALDAYKKSVQPGGEEWSRIEQTWRAEAKADKELGATPEEFARNMDLAKRYSEKEFPPEMLDFVYKAGLGSNKYFLKYLVKRGREMSEDTLVRGNTTPQGKPKSLGEKLYGATTPTN